MFIGLAVLGVFTVGITWLVLAWVLRSLPTRVDADGVHFLLRRTYAASEIDEVSNVTFVASSSAGLSPRGRGLGLRFHDGTEITVRGEYLDNLDELLTALTQHQLQG